MYFEIADGEVLLSEEVETSSQRAVVRKHHGWEKKIRAEADKTVLVINEQANIIFIWQKFDITTGDWLDDPMNAGPIELDIDGVKLELQPVSGTDILVFSSGEPGPVVIRTENIGVDNASMEVTVNA